MTEIEKLEAQVAEWMGVANQQILRIQELEKRVSEVQHALELAKTFLTSKNVMTDAAVQHILATEKVENVPALAYNVAKSATTYEEVIDNVRVALKLESTHYLVIADEVADVVKGRDSALAIARQAVGVLLFAQRYITLETVDAFLSRPEAKAIGGGK